jgi:methionyl-tRNA formyltransferase
VKIFLCGQKYFGWLVFGVLRDLGHEVIGVAAPIESGHKPDRLYKAAIALDIPYVIPGGSLRAANFPEGVDLIVCAHSYDFVSLPVIARAKFGGIGYHPSLLPLHRGRDAVRWTLKMGDSVTGGTVYWLSKNVDAGPIAAQDYFFVPKGTTPEQLWRERLQPLGVKLFAKVISDLAAGRVIAIPQDESVATWEPSIGRPPIFRPDLPQIGRIEGVEVITSKSSLNTEPPLSHGWRALAGG